MFNLRLIFKFNFWFYKYTTKYCMNWSCNLNTTLKLSKIEYQLKGI